MAEELIISISGLRGIVGKSLSPAIASEYASAFGTFLRKKFPSEKDKIKVCLGRDSRPSGQMLNSAVAAGLCSVGIDVIDIGIISTPAVGIVLRHLNCKGGVVITASHNPIEYNGIKLLLEDGIAPDPKTAEEIKKYYLVKKFDFVDSVDSGKVSSDASACDVHIEKVLALVNPEKIAQRKFKVVLDSVNGAGAAEGKALLLRLGCDVVAVNDKPDGNFAHQPEPTAENLTSLCEVVKKKNADIGFAQDPDADRLAIVDEKGNYIGEEYTLALAAKTVLQHNKGSAAANLSTSRMLDDIAEQAGVKVFRTAVGEANVARAMMQNNCIIGGEGNGGIIDLKVGPVRDSLVGIIYVLQFMAETGKTISQLAADIKPYIMIKKKFPCDKQRFEMIKQKAVEIFPDASVDTADGCRFDFQTGWLHLRPSNTEPVVRVIAEFQDAQIAQEYIDKVLNIQKEDR